MTDRRTYAARMARDLKKSGWTASVTLAGPGETTMIVRAPQRSWPLIRSVLGPVTVDRLRHAGVRKLILSAGGEYFTILVQ